MIFVQVVGVLVGILELANILICELVRLREHDDIGIIKFLVAVWHDRHCEDWLQQFPQSLIHRQAHSFECYSDIIDQLIIILLKLHGRGVQLKNHFLQDACGRTTRVVLTVGAIGV